MQFLLKTSRNEVNSEVAMALPAAKPETGSVVAAFVKICLVNCGPEHFPAHPENACLKHANFLKLSFPKNLSKPDMRKAFLNACRS